MKFADDKEFDIIGIGRNSWDKILAVDYYPKPDEKMAVNYSSNQCGGQVANTLVAASKLGLKTKYLGKFGDDANGQAVRNALFKATVDISASKIIPGVANQSAVIIVDQKHFTRNVFTQKDSKLDIHPGDFQQKDYTKGKILYLGARNVEEIKSFAKIARAKECVIAVDLDQADSAAEDLLSSISILFCPKSYLDQFVPEDSVQSKMRLLHEKHSLDLICCTMGAQGSVAYDGRHFVQREAYKINVTDTTGAGDVFQAGFLYYLLQNKPIDQCLDFGNAAAALKCRQMGSQQGVPTIEEIEDFIDDQEDLKEREAASSPSAHHSQPEPKL